MRIVFMGSGEVACPALRRLATGACGELVGVVTQPDRPRGRGRQPEACPARRAAAEAGIPVLTPDRVRDPAVVSEIAALRPDILVVAAYGQFLPRALLELPPLGAINVHPSLLPRYRGAAPIQWAIANGERETGVSIVFMTERMDAGDVIVSERVAIGDEDTALTLTPRLAEVGARLLAVALEAVRSGHPPRIPQDERLVTLAPKLTKEDGRIVWMRPAEQIRNRVRGFQPWPGAYFDWPRRGWTVRVTSSSVEPGDGPPGRVLTADARGPLVATGDGALRLTGLQPEGRRAMTGGAFCAGYRPEPGEQFA